LNKMIFGCVALGVVAALSAQGAEKDEKLKRHSDGIAGQYIVVLKGDKSQASEKSEKLIKKYGGKTKHVFKNAIGGYAVEMDDSTAINLSQDEDVEYVEQDIPMQANATQSSAPWGLDRIDQRERSLNSTYTYNAMGNGVSVYVIDTGIRTTHSDFGGRASLAYTTISDGRGAGDCNGHGTHVAASIGGNTYGVAKGVRLYAVRVLGCNGSGSNSGVIAGVDWVAANRRGPTVVNMSLGGGASTALDTAVKNAIASGVTFAVAAGNENANACNSSPARVPTAITVGATNSSDSRASFSNWGSCLDVFAPGESIRSAWYTSDTALATLSGTSMASPHVAGVAALYLEANPTATPAAVDSGLKASATTGKVTSLGTGSPNVFLYSLVGSVVMPTPSPSPSPSPNPSVPCTDCTPYTGSLTGKGYSAYQPNGSYYYSSAAGAHQGWLQGPAGTDFDLYLQKWNGNAWANVATSAGSSSTEQITYNGTAGYYRFRIYSYAGSGNYSFWLKKP
jgi:subtilisin family serine protease